MKIHKFGGSILKNEYDIQIIKDLIVNLEEPSIFVFSAFFGITDKLIEILKFSKDKSDDLKLKIDYFVDFHNNLCKKLNINTEIIANYLNDVQKISNSVLTLGHYSSKISDSFLIYGELLSSKIIFEYISKFTEINYLDSRDFIKTDSSFSSAKIDFTETEKKIKSFINFNSKYVIAGFIGSNKDKESTTLGRNGSDYTAATIAAILNAKNLTIWKDVDGVFSADPKIVKNSIFIDRISYKEMTELSYFGNKVIAFKALDPAIKNLVSICVKNLYNPKSLGSLISVDTNIDFQVKGITKLDNIYVLTIDSDKNKIDSNFFYKRIFDLFSLNKIEPVFFNKSSSGINFTVGIRHDDCDNIFSIFESEFSYELEKNFISFDYKILSIISVVGFNLTKISGIIYNISNFLQRENIVVPLIIDSLSDYSISIGVDAVDSNKVVQLLHLSFFGK